MQKPAAEQNNDPIAAVLLAGWIQQSYLYQQLGIPALCLPVDGQRTLFDIWCQAICSIEQCDLIRIIASSEHDARQIEDVRVQRADTLYRHGVDIQVVCDPATWRGPGGLIKDVTQDLQGHRILVAEGACLPPPDLQRFVEWLDPDASGLSISGSEGKPAGVYILTRHAIDAIPSIGFYDIKEQLLPALYASGNPLLACELNYSVVRIRTRESYLEAIRCVHDRESRGSYDTSHAESTSYIIGSCAICDSARIDDESVIHESAVLDGAVVERHAVVSQCVVGPSAHVPARTVLRRQTVAYGRVSRWHWPRYLQWHPQSICSHVRHVQGGAPA